MTRVVSRRGVSADSVAERSRTGPHHDQAMPGEVDILEIEHSDRTSVASSEAAFTVINADSPTPDYGLNNSYPTYRKPTNYTNNLNRDHETKTYQKTILNGTMADDFVNTLDKKLKDLEDKKKKYKKAEKPLFITTVKTGIFLDPPPELAALLGYPRSYNTSSGSNSEKSSDGLMYSYSSHPRVLNNKVKPKMNNEKAGEKFQVRNNIRTKRETSKKPDKPSPEVIPYGNVMYDRRVVRGPAFMHHPLPTVGLETPAARQAEARRRAMARRKAQNTRARNLRLRLSTPPPVEGRKHEDIQTEQYLEEHPAKDTTYTQTDYFVDRPPTPKFVPAKTGMDVSTQIYPGELFHFDTEVRPILEVLVGKTVEQALIEVMEEDELASIREQQRRFKEIRNAEKAEESRLEEEELRKRKEIEMRVLEQEEAIRDQRSTEDRIAAAVLTTGYIADLLPSVIKDLSKGGFLYDEVKEEVDEKFMPWLMKEVKTEMQKMVENKDLLSEILKEIIETRAEIYHALGEREDKLRGSPELEGEEEEIGSPLPNLDEMAEEGEEEPLEEAGEEEENKAGETENP